MARNFVAASSQSLISGSAPITAVPLTLCCWYRPVSIAAAYRMLSINDATTNNYFALGQDSIGRVVATNKGGGVVATATTAAAATAGAWTFATALFQSASSRSALINGGSKGSDPSNLTPAGVNRVEIGALVGATFMNGDIAECCIWNIALADADVAALAAGVAPWFVHPEAIVAYWPLVHGYSPEIELFKSNNMTLTNAPAIAPHPPIFYRSGSRAA